MKEQTIFNTVVRHLAKQGKRAVTVEEDGSGLCVEVCKYRGPNGTKCAAGCLLKDSEYDPDMEGKPVGLIKLPKRLQPHEELLHRLQQAHDTSTTATYLIDNLRLIAEDFNLDTKVLGAVEFPTWK
jgi:hypothetical protein